MHIPSWLTVCLVVGQLVGCASMDVAHEDAAPAPSRWSAASSSAPASASGAPAHWEHFKLPGKRPTQFAYVQVDGRDAMAVTAVSSASMLRKAVRIEPSALGHVRFSWKVPALISGADMAQRDKDDAPVRVVLAFEGDRSLFSPKNAMLSEMARMLTGEEMPYATLMYVWCNQRLPGSVIVNPRTDRVRKLVVETGPGRLNQWLEYERDIRADYLAAFGEEPGALVGVGIMTDSDNTHSTTKAWYGPVSTTLPVAARN